MPRAFEATCVGGVVKVGSLPVPTAVILCEGVGSSSGILLVDKDQATYMAKVTPDLKAALEQTIAGLNQAVTALTHAGTALTAIGAGMAGPATAPPPTLATDVAAITTAGAQITAAATQLETLKGMLK